MVKLSFVEDPKQPGVVLRLLNCDCGTNFLIIDLWQEQCPGCRQLYNAAGQKLVPSNIFDLDPEWPDQGRI